MRRHTYWTCSNTHNYLTISLAASPGLLCSFRMVALEGGNHSFQGCHSFTFTVKSFMSTLFNIHTCVIVQLGTGSYLLYPKFPQWQNTTLAFCSYPLDSLCYDSLYLVWVKSQAGCFPLNDLPPCLPIPTGLSREAELTVLRLSNQASSDGALKQ